MVLLSLSLSLPFPLLMKKELFSSFVWCSFLGENLRESLLFNGVHEPWVHHTHKTRETVEGSSFTVWMGTQKYYWNQHPHMNTHKHTHTHTVNFEASQESCFARKRESENERTITTFGNIIYICSFQSLCSSGLLLSVEFCRRRRRFSSHHQTAATFPFFLFYFRSKIKVKTLLISGLLFCCCSVRFGSRNTAKFHWSVEEVLFMWNNRKLYGFWFLVEVSVTRDNNSD